MIRCRNTSLETRMTGGGLAPPRARSGPFGRANSAPASGGTRRCRVTGLFGALLAAAIVLPGTIACSDDSNDVANTETATATTTSEQATPETTATSGRGEGSDPTVQPATPLPTDTPPTDWKTLNQQSTQFNEAFSLSYPPDWGIASQQPVAGGGGGLTVTLTSFSSDPLKHGGFPKGGIKLELVAFPSGTVTCEPEGVTDITVAGMPARGADLVYPGNTAGVTHGQMIQLTRGTFTYCFSASYAGGSADRDKVAMILNSLIFESTP